MTETPNLPADSWETLLDTLRRRYPGQKDSVLFCIYKLQQNPDLSLRDFREEADLHGIPMAGRSLHSAKVLLGLIRETAAAEPAPVLPPPLARTTLNPERAAARRQRRVANNESEESVEQKVIAAVRSIQNAAGEETQRLRQAVREAIALLQRAIGD